MLLSDRQTNGFDILSSESESNNEDDNDGEPQLGQIHVQLIVFSSSYMNEVKPLHLL